MKIVLVNPPNCGRSIPEEEFGITSLKMIFRGEPLALEVLAGNLLDHDVTIIDLKAEPDGLDGLFAEKPDVVGFTAVTCEANTVVTLARKIKREFGASGPTIVVGGHHASSDPAFFDVDGIDYVVIGLGKHTFRLLVDQLEKGEETGGIVGVFRTGQGEGLSGRRRRCDLVDLVDDLPPRYDLVKPHRDKYVMSGVGGRVGFVVTAFGCTHACAFCSIPTMTGGRYLSHSVEAIVRDMALLSDIPLIRFVDANTFGDIAMATTLAKTICDLGIDKHIVADVRADTVVSNPELMRLWKKAGLSAVVIGFEEIDDRRLQMMNKKSSQEIHRAALDILAEIGIRVIGDFIISPDYGYEDFEALARFIERSSIALPIPSILTPIPGTPLHHRLKKDLEITDLDYYTFSNAVLPTRLNRKVFYTLYAELMKDLHQHITKQPV